MRPDWLAITGLLLNLVGAVLIARSSIIVQGWADPDAYERVYGDTRHRRLVTGSGHVQRGNTWRWGWIAMVVGYALQGVGALRIG
jgi:heme O synthase-like polyprenyltransferase